MTRPWYTLSLVIVTLVQAVSVNCQCDKPAVVRVPLYRTASINSPGYPDNYATNLNCSWIFEFDHATDYFFVRMDNVYVDCKGDIIRLINLETDTNIVSFCEDATTSDIYTQSGRLKVEFTTNGVQRDNDRGFVIRVTSIPKVSTDVAACPAEGDVELTAGNTDKVLTSQNFPNKYPSSQVCHWKIPSKTGYKIQISVDFRDIEYATAPPEDPVDYLLIRYVADNSTQQKQYSGRWNFEPVPNNEITSVGDVDLTFKTDSDTSYSGFRLRYKLVELATQSQTTTEDTISKSQDSLYTSPDTLSSSPDILSTSPDSLYTSPDTLPTSEDVANNTEDNVSTREDTASTSDIVSIISITESTTTENITYTTEDTVYIIEASTQVSTDRTSSPTTETDVPVITETSTADAMKIETSDVTHSLTSDTTSDVTHTLTSGATSDATSDVTHTLTSDATSDVTHTLTSDVMSDVTHTITSDVTETVSSDITKLVTPIGVTTKDDTKQKIVIPRYVYESKVEPRTSSCEVLTCVVPLVVAICLLLSILFVVIVALGVTRSRRRDRYRVGKVNPGRPFPTVAETTNSDFNL